MYTEDISPSKWKLYGKDKVLVGGGFEDATKATSPYCRRAYQFECQKCGTKREVPTHPTDAGPGMSIRFKCACCGRVTKMDRRPANG